MKEIREGSSSVLRRLRRNFTILFSGTVAVGLFGLAALALNTRALGPSDFGIFVLVQSYVVILGRVFSFDTWQAIIKFGAECRARDDLPGLRALSNFAMLFDAGSSVAAGGMGLLLLFLFPELLGLSDAALRAALVYTATLLFQLPGAPVGLMRLFDKFSWLTAITVAEAALRFLASAMLFIARSPLSAYFYSFAAILVAANVARLIASLILLRRATGPLRLSGLDEMRKVRRRIMLFSSGSWLTGTLNVTRRDGTTLIVAALLGPAAAGLYGLAVRIIRPIRDIAELLRQAMFPDLARLVAEGQHANVSVVVWRILLHTVPVALAITIAGIVFGDLAIRTVAGREYAGSYWPMVFLLAAASLYLCMPLLSSLAILYAGMRKYALATLGAVTVWALVFLWPMLIWGVAGAAVGELIFVLAWAAIIVRLLRQTSRGSPIDGHRKGIR
jgi:O-antigen/teichoic acid export membrane protein